MCERKRANFLPFLDPILDSGAEANGSEKLIADYTRVCRPNCGFVPTHISFE
jgi:hypothetical protein